MARKRRTPGRKAVDKYLKAFAEHMGQVDETAQTILKGHLIIESALDNIIDLIFFNPDYIHNARLRFAHKLQIARAIALGKAELSMWNLLHAINTVRNDIAHNLFNAEERERKFAALRRALADEEPEVERGATDTKVASDACAMATGFLGALEEDLKALRGFIDALGVGEVE